MASKKKVSGKAGKAVEKEKEKILKGALKDIKSGYRKGKKRPSARAKKKR